MVRLEKVTKKFGETVALNNVSFTAEKGEVLGFLGPNGAGKTTAMRIITGFLTPNEGRVEVGGVDVAENPLLARRKIGYLPEDAPLYGEMKTAEFLEFIAEIREVKDKDRFEEMVKKCGLEEVLDKKIEELSRGYRQRVGLVQALLHNPEVLILDEPTSGLDPNQIVEIRNLIKNLGKEKTIILSTHVLPEVAVTCSRVVIINKGKIVAEGGVEEVTEKGRRGLEDVFRKMTLEEGVSKER